MKSITITQLDDGTFNVETEPSGMEMPTEAPDMPEGTPQDSTEDMGEGEPQQTYQTIDEALDAVRAEFGGAESVGAGPMMEGEADFVNGFKNARGANGGY